jgi:hypothetical protein
VNSISSEETEIKKSREGIVDVKRTSKEIFKNDFGYQFYIDGLNPSAIDKVVKVFNLLFLARILFMCVGILVFQASPIL